MTSPVSQHPSLEAIIIHNEKWRGSSGSKLTSPMSPHPSPERIIICCLEWSWAEGPASRWQVQRSIIQVRNQSNHYLSLCVKLKEPLQNSRSNSPSFESRNNHDLSLGMKLEAQRQNNKSNASSYKSGNNHNLSLGMKLGRRPSFKMKSPAPHHPSPETIIISH